MSFYSIAFIANHGMVMFYAAPYNFDWIKITAESAKSECCKQSHAGRKITETASQVSHEQDTSIILRFYFTSQEAVYNFPGTCLVGIYSIFIFIWCVLDT